MPYASVGEWPPAAQVPNQERVVRRCMWPVGGELVWELKSEEQAPMRSSLTMASSTALAGAPEVEPFGGLDEDTAKAIIERAAGETTIPTASTDDMEQMRHAFVVQHAW